MTHHYLIEYRWGRKAAKREKLVVPFRLVVRHPVEAHIRTFIGEARSVAVSLSRAYRPCIKASLFIWWHRKRSIRTLYRRSIPG